MSSDDKYSLLNIDNLTQPSQMRLSQKEIFFLNLFDYFWGLDWISKIFKKKKKRWPSQLMYFRNYRIQKTWLEKNLFRTPFERQHGPNTNEICTTAPLLYLLTTANAFELEKVSRSEIKVLGLFVITLTGDDKYPLLLRDNLTFLNLLLHFPNDSHSWWISEITDPEERGYINV